MISEKTQRNLKRARKWKILEQKIYKTTKLYQDLVLIVQLCCYPVDELTWEI